MRAINRREFVRAVAGATVLGALPSVAAEPQKETYENQAKGLRIFPGAWRPHYSWEHIAWISPSWPSQDYIWLDFPEAVFTDRGLLFLSHVNPAAPAVYPNWAKVDWKAEDDRISFERVLLDGVAFGGTVFKELDNVAGLELRFKNGSKEPLRKITLQTCAFLRAIKEFADPTPDNKYVHVKEKGWMRFIDAKALAEDTGTYGLGWRTHNNRKADVPMMATISNNADRLVAMTWMGATLSLVQNPGHPCMHADPQVKDLDVGEETTIRGRLIFFDGKLADFPYQDYL